jgi:hypothetical protein
MYAGTRLRADVRAERRDGRRRHPHLTARCDAGPALETLERERVTVFVGVPTMYRPTWFVGEKILQREIEVPAHV